MNAYLCFLVCLHFPLAVNTTVVFLDLRKVSSSSELKPFLLSMCNDAAESTGNSPSGDFEVGPALPLLQ